MRLARIISNVIREVNWWVASERARETRATKSVVGTRRRTMANGNENTARLPYNEGAIPQDEKREDEKKKENREREGEKVTKKREKKNREELEETISLYSHVHLVGGSCSFSVFSPVALLNIYIYTYIWTYACVLRATGLALFGLLYGDIIKNTAGTRNLPVHQSDKKIFVPE